jgi:hypothetical protein
MPATEPFSIEMTPDATAAAAKFTNPEALAEYARVELISAGLADVEPARCVGDKADVLACLHFDLGGKTWGVWPHAERTWQLTVVPDRVPMKPILPAYELVLTDRAKLAARQHDLPLGYVEMEARRALAWAEPDEDAGCALFAVPVLELGFRVWPLDGDGSDGGRVEIDLVADDGEEEDAR